MRRVTGTVLLFGLSFLIVTAITGSLWATISSACLVGAATVITFLARDKVKRTEEARSVVQGLVIDDERLDLEGRNTQLSAELEKLHGSLRESEQREEAAVLSATRSEAASKRTLDSLEQIGIDLGRLATESRSGLDQLSRDLGAAIEREQDELATAEVVPGQVKPPSQDAPEIERSGATALHLESALQRLREISEARDGLSGPIRQFADSLEDVAEAANEMVELSEQANILAINASIEAARLGSAGRGFRVIAGAMQELSGKIRDIVGRTKTWTGSDFGAGSVDDIARDLSRLRDSAREIVRLLADVSPTGAPESVSTVDKSLRSSRSAVLSELRERVEALSGSIGDAGRIAATADTLAASLRRRSAVDGGGLEQEAADPQSARSSASEDVSEILGKI